MYDECPKKPAATGSPAWVMTFADLMSLLMCFFVLLLSFSEMDVAKYKQLAGSMKNAFGVQRKVEVKEPPKGINIIAQEFSAGRPQPTPMNVVEQETTNEVLMFLDTGGKARKPGEEGAPPDGQEGAATADKTNHQTGEAGKNGETPAPGETDKSPGEAESLPKGAALRALQAAQQAEREHRLKQSADEIRAALRSEIKAGAVDVETESQKIVIRIREKASFPSGGAVLRASFRPLLVRVGEVLKETEGRIIVSGHTDDIPIANQRFRSNWELSAGRAVSVVHELIYAAKMPSDRFSIEGLAETRPMAPNDTAENRARNRRVEIKLVQGDDLDHGGEITTPSVAPAAEPNIEPAEPAAPTPAPDDEDPFIRKG